MNMKIEDDFDLQRIADPAIRRSVEMLCECSGERKLDCREQVYHAFPKPVSLAALGERELKACGLGYRWSYVHEAAEAVVTGDLNLGDLCNASEETAIHTLMALKGVGIKVASCVSLFGLHHMDAFPRDVWVKRVIENDADYPVLERDISDEESVKSDEELEKEVVPLIPMGELIQPEDIAETVLFLASKQAKMLTGQVIKVSGGHAL